MASTQNEQLLKRFVIVPLEYETPSGFVHCNTKRTWQVFLSKHFSQYLNKRLINYPITLSNAAFRLSGLELKIGLLLAHDEAKSGQKKFLSGSVIPSIVIDSVLAIFAILEGLSYLSYISSLPTEEVKKDLDRPKRGDKISKGIKHLVGRSVATEVSALRGLRDRCIHQDCADLRGDLDYEHVYSANALKTHCGLLFEFLSSMSETSNPLPNTNFNEFYRAHN